MKRLFLAALSLFLLVLAGQAPAATQDTVVTVTDQDGRPVADAVLVLDIPSAKKPRPGHYEITQRDMAFVPDVLVIPVGSTVEFGNLDPYRHHVYSFSQAKSFELKLFGNGERRAVRFDKPGLVGIGCNIHDSMKAYIRVVDTPFAAKTGANGKALFRGVPAGRHTLTVYHPRLRQPGKELATRLDPDDVRTLSVGVRLRHEAPKRHSY